MPAVQAPSRNNASVNLVPRPQRRCTDDMARAHRAHHKSQRKDGKCHQRAVKRRDINGKNSGKHQHAGDTKDKSRNIQTNAQ